MTTTVTVQPDAGRPSAATTPTPAVPPRNSRRRWTLFGHTGPISASHARYGAEFAGSCAAVAATHLETSGSNHQLIGGLT